MDKGQREDWLSSEFIRVFFVLMLVGIIAGIVWELRQKDPVVDLRMLKNRNFAIATMAMFFLGFVLYASTVLIPQLLQDIAGILGGTGGTGAFARRRGDHADDAGGGISGVTEWTRGYLITFGCMRVRDRAVL